MKRKLLIFTFLLFQFSFGNVNFLFVYDNYNDITLNNPEIPNLNPLTVCDTNNDGFAVFNLSLQSPIILAAQSGSSSNYTVTYHESFTDASLGISPLNASSYDNINPYSQTIYYRIVDTTTSEYAVGSFSLEINIPLQVTTPTPLNKCDDDSSPNDQYSNFDLTVKIPDILQGAVGCVVDFYPSLANAYANTNQITTPTNYVNIVPVVQTLGVKVTNSSGCVSYTTLNIRVLPIPTPNTNPPLLGGFCENSSGSGVVTVDITTSASYIVNGDPNVVLHYFASLSDALTNVNEILNPTSCTISTNTIYIRVSSTSNFDYTGTGCYKIVSQSLVINPLPLTEIISNNGLNIVYVDNNNNIIQSLLLDSQVTGNYSYQWYLNGVLIPDATSSTYLITTASLDNNPRNYVVYVENITTGCSATSSVFSVYQAISILPPSGSSSQSFTEGQTLADIVVSGENIQWYSSANGTTPLPLNTPLVNGVTYYATQTVNGTESVARLAVTVTVALGVSENQLLNVLLSPNPSKHAFQLQARDVLKSIELYNLLGQKVLEQQSNSTQLSVDISHLHSGNYILKVYSDNGQKTLRFIKE